MIFGVGTDIVELSRVQATYERFGDHFVKRILMDEELELFAKTKWPVRFLAMRFAGGVLMVEATKRVSAPTRGLTERVSRPLRALEGLTQPRPKPVGAQRAPRPKSSPKVS